MDNIDDIYERKFGITEDVKSLGWGSVESQENRFSVLLEINGFSKNDTVIDVGCGYGDMSMLITNYTGIDIRERAISIASKKYTDRKFIKCDIDNINNKYDWAIASGIFCFNIANWEDYVEKTIKKMYDVSNKGVSINFLSDLSIGKRDPDMKYSSITEISHIINRITNRFTIRHDYQPNDVTVYLYK